MRLEESINKYFDNLLSESSDRNVISAKVRRDANKICQKYNGWHEPQEIRPMWDELSAIGIDVLISGYPDSISDSGAKSWTVIFDYNGIPCDNSRFVFSLYEGNGESLKNEYEMYFS